MIMLIVQVNGPIPKSRWVEGGGEGGGGNQPGVPEENPRQPVRKSAPHIRARGENSPPQLEPSPSNIGDEFAW